MWSDWNLTAICGEELYMNNSLVNYRNNWAWTTHTVIDQLLEARMLGLKLDHGILNLIEWFHIWSVTTKLTEYVCAMYLVSSLDVMFSWCVCVCVCVCVHPDAELSVLKAEFGHHAEKLDEYEQMRKEIDRLEGER